MSARATRPRNLTFFVFTCLTQRVSISRRTPARCSRPDNLTFSIPRPARLTHPDCEYLPPVGCRREPTDHATWPFSSLPVRHSESRSPVGCRRGAPGQTTLPFQASCSVRLTLLTQRVLSSRQTSARASQLDKLTFRSCGRRGLPNHAAGWLPEDHLTLPFSLNLSDLVSPDLPTDAGESTHDQTILPFQVPLSARITRPTPRALISHQTSARASQPDKLIFSVLSHHNIEPPSNATYPIGQAILVNQTLPFRLHLSDTVSLDLPSVAGETTLPFLVPHWWRLPVRHSGYCAPFGRRREPPCRTSQTLFICQADRTHPSGDGVLCPSRRLHGPSRPDTALCPLISSGWRPVGPVQRLRALPHCRQLGSSWSGS